MTQSPMTHASMTHVPVMLAEMLEYLLPQKGEVIIDGTFGQGGYSAAILASAECRVIGFDRDPAAASAAARVAASFPGRFQWVERKFSEIEEYIQSLNAPQISGQIDGLVLDLGVSSPQIDTPARGFSFRFDGPLDMRMGQNAQNAAEVIATASETELADAIYHYGDERYARRIARAIVAARKTAPITSTTQLAELVRRIVPRSKDGIDPATRTFQALRILVNDELGELSRVLAASLRFLRPGGRLVVVSFHSAEDAMVKSFLRQFGAAGGSGVSRHVPQILDNAKQSPHSADGFRILTKKPILPGAAEAKANPRARSARLRAAVKYEGGVA